MAWWGVVEGARGIGSVDMVAERGGTTRRVEKALTRGSSCAICTKGSVSGWSLHKKRRTGGQSNLTTSRIHV